MVGFIIKSTNEQYENTEQLAKEGVRVKRSEMLPPDEQEKYILIDNTCTKYEALYGWQNGTVLRRISVWYGSNGCGRNLKQAYFVTADSNQRYGHIVWSDHIKAVTGQLEMDF